ncbi:MAG: 2-hydroxyacyl-CoA dehydratase family protein, partial [Phycisphaerales bacterium]|nr:2-hydroxyacyl-CoA dehydratase family protein [Phycisphaerales bacterium]
MLMTVFNEWGGEPLDEIMYHCRELVEDTTFPTIKRWREQGGKTLGHFQVYFPEELAHAAGMMPVKMCGTMLEPNNADSHFGSYLCSIIKTSLEAALSGGIELDIFVSHPICDAARNLA